MRAVGALDVVGHHGLILLRILKVNHSSILPRVITSCQEKDILSSDVFGPEVGVGSIGIWDRELFSEDAATVVSEEGDIEIVSSLSVNAVACLEESKLCAVLPGPLSHTLVDVDGGVLETSGIVL